MICGWKIAYTMAVLTGTFVIESHSTEAFFAPRRHNNQRNGAKQSKSIGFIESSSSEREWNSKKRRLTQLFVGSTGWDNDNFLDALSKGSDALDKANEEYRKQSRFANMRPASADDDDGMVDDLGIVGGTLGSSVDDDIDDSDGIKDATLSKDQIERIKRQNEEESGGGEIFKKLLERAQQGATLKEQLPPPSPSPPPPQPQPQAPQSPTASDASGPVLPEGFEKLSVEAQAALFRQLMTSSPQEATQQQWPPAPGPRPEAKGQAMVAPDGRKIGRNRDADALVNTSDVYFAQLKLDSAVRNDARMQGDSEKAEAVFADPTIPQLKLHVNPYMEEQRKKELAMIETAADEMFTPEILGEMRKEVNLNDRGVSFKEMLEQKRRAAAQQQSQSATTSPQLPSTVDPPIVNSRVESIREQESLPIATSKVPVQTNTAQSPQSTRPSVPSNTNVAITTKAEDETRRDIRTLMGLLIKHRGGPGFGAGRIVGPEIERFTSLSSDIISLLRSETDSSPITRSFPNRVEQSTPKTDLTTTTPQRLATIPSSVPDYSNTPADGAITQTPMIPVGDRINSVLACIEGAITMYKNSPPELQRSVLVTLRAALLSAVSTCNEIVAVNEGEQFESYRTALTDPRTRNNNMPSAYSNPTQYYDVTPEISEPPSLHALSSMPYTAASQPSTIQGGMEAGYRTERSDESAAFLESVYQRLKDAAGDGKMGLRQDLNAVEAEELANDISRMRDMLVVELNGNSMDRDTSKSSQPPAAAQYKQMLAKVRADKDAAGTD
jgi:hypothetical protein